MRARRIDRRAQHCINGAPECIKHLSETVGYRAAISDDTTTENKNMGNQNVFPNIETLLLRCAGIVLALVSTAALVLLLISLPMQQTPMIMTGVAGVALQLCLYLFIRSASRKLKVTSLVLLFLSIIATAAFLESNWQQHLVELKDKRQTKTESSYTAQQLQRQITEINEQVELILQSSELDINHGYRQRSDQRMNELEPLHLQRESLQQQLATLNNHDLNDVVTGSFPTILSDLGKSARITMFAFVAALLDFIAMIALSVKRQPSLTSFQDDSSTVHFDSAQWCILLQERILSGEFGNYPSQRQMKAEVVQAFEALIDNRQLIKEGKRFKLNNGGPQMEWN
ncbi:hypothetical protein [Endozoicomonas ascidiicola]|uniref:hypothetical protein n=1 Tax=Endozoicomonas ascidiicola TaxID=1698521 RepID=UPI0012FA06FC|nr:hypothetical protein [Endozoicomonas ascidiicola]